MRYDQGPDRRRVSKPQPGQVNGQVHGPAGNLRIQRLAQLPGNNQVGFA
jgi:hypothetical protein